MSDRLLYKPEEAAARLSIGRNKMFELLASGKIESIQIGRSRRIPHDALEDYVASLRGADPVPAAAVSGAE